MTKGEAIRKIERVKNLYAYESDFEAFDMAIEALSTDIVRCKDCKYGELDDPEFPNEYFCRYKGLDWNDGEHFCSNAERKENERT